MKEFGLIGYPLEHSFSKKYFTEKFEKENLADFLFELFPIDSIEKLPGLIAAHPHLLGLAVTIPYKQSVMKFLNHLSPEAAAIGAVNCIKISSHGILTGFNTDALGFEKSLVTVLQSTHKHALVLGSGGAAKAVQYVLAKLGIPFHTVSRRQAQADFIYSQLTRELMDTHQIIINCTPLGMFPHTDAHPDLPYEFIDSRHLLYDLVYNPSETLFLKRGADRGATTKNGYEMLLLQAAENWLIWNTN